MFLENQVSELSACSEKELFNFVYQPLFTPELEMGFPTRTMTPSCESMDSSFAYSAQTTDSTDLFYESTVTPYQQHMVSPFPVPVYNPAAPQFIPFETPMYARNSPSMNSAEAPSFISGMEDSPDIFFSMHTLVSP